MKLFQYKSICRLTKDEILNEVNLEKDLYYYAIELFLCA